jgi:hypothetical protein
MCSSSHASTSVSTYLSNKTNKEGLKRESFRKKKAVMHIGYVGTDYRGKRAYVFFLFFFGSCNAVLYCCENYFIFLNMIIHVLHSLCCIAILQKQCDTHELSSTMLIFN